MVAETSESALYISRERLLHCQGIKQTHNIKKRLPAAAPLFFSFTKYSTSLLYLDLISIKFAKRNPRNYVIRASANKNRLLFYHFFGGFHQNYKALKVSSVCKDRRIS